MINILEEKIIYLALLEDQASGDQTTDLLVESGKLCSGSLFAKENFTLAGSDTFCNTFKVLTNSPPEITFQKNDGEVIRAGETFAYIEGDVKTILMGERIALNFLQHLSGIATLTKRFVAIASRYGVKILDTRKTTPGLRYLEKKAVLAGGGTNHRFSLSDSVLIKDNHIAACGGSIGEALSRVKDKKPYLGKVEIEVKNLEELNIAIDMGADVIMLDNMNVSEITEAVRLARGKTRLEVSGGITLDNIEEMAKTGVYAISVGALTHSAPNVDISLELNIPSQKL